MRCNCGLTTADVMNVQLVQGFVRRFARSILSLDGRRDASAALGFVTSTRSSQQKALQILCRNSQAYKGAREITRMLHRVCGAAGACFARCSKRTLTEPDL